MSNQITLSASLPVRRIIEGDTLSLYFTTNGKPLYQGYNPNDSNVTPDWGAADNQPEITPHVGSARKQSVQLIGHKWSYNGVIIPFGSPDKDGWCTSQSPFKGMFKVNDKTGTLRIVANLASEDNQDSDVITYNGKALLGASNYEMEKSESILISPLGSSAYVGGITASTTMLGVQSNGEEVTQAELQFWLMNSATSIQNFQIQMYKGNNKEGKKFSYEGNNPFIITRDNVNSHQLYIAEFYVSGIDLPVYRAAISIDDAADEYQIKLYASGSGYSASQSVVVKAAIKNVTTQQDVALTNGNIVFEVFSANGNKLMRSETVSFTTAEQMRAASITISNSDGDVDDVGVTVNATITGSIAE